MRIELISLKLENFKGVKAFEVRPDGLNGVISGRNGTGKTSVYDAFLWLLFGKNSEGAKSFEVRPLDENNERINDLTVLVEATLSFDGIQHVFRKTEEGDYVKGQLKGYKTLCWVDDVPKKNGEYAKAVADYVSEETFKLLTNLHHFCEMHWTERRKNLLTLAGEISEPEGFGELVAMLNGRSVDDFKKVLAEQKQRYTKERDEIPPRIDELTKSLPVATDTKAVESERQVVINNIAALDRKRQEAWSKEKERQAAIDKVNSLKLSLANREFELLHDKSAVAVYVQERTDINQKRAELVNAISTARLAMDNHNSRVIVPIEAAIENGERELQKIRNDYTAISGEAVDTKCPYCEQELPEGKLLGLTSKLELKKADIAKRGNFVKKQIADKRAELDVQGAKLVELEKEYEKANILLAEFDEANGIRLAELEQLIGGVKPVDPKTDEIWTFLSVQIEKAQNDIPQSASEAMERIESNRRAYQTELDRLNSALAMGDKIKTDTARIEELKAKERELGQKLADIEATLAQIQLYKDAQSAAVELAVNGMFKHITFKLFNRLINGNTEDCCIPMLNGVPYSDMSYGQRILCGVDVINTMSRFYGLQVPLFIDNAESLTLPVETQMQTIKMYAQEGELSFE